MSKNHKNKAVPTAPVLDNTEETVTAADIEKIFPLRLTGFKISTAKGYPVTEGRGDNAPKIGVRRKVAEAIFSLVGPDGPTKAYVLGNVSVSRFDKSIKGQEDRKDEWNFGLPSAMKAGGAFFEAIIKTDDAETSAAIEHLKTVLLPTAFKEWATRNPEVMKVITGDVTASARGATARTGVTIDF